jgi:hypothetical protein
VENCPAILCCFVSSICEPLISCLVNRSSVLTPEFCFSLLVFKNNIRCINKMQGEVKGEWLVRRVFFFS